MAGSGSAAVAASPKAIERSSSGEIPGLLWQGGFAASFAWAAASAVTLFWPDIEDWGYTQEFGHFLAAFAVLLFVLGLAGRRLGPLYPRLSRGGAWIVALAAGILVWEIVTIKTGWLPKPFFVAPQELFGVYLDDWQRLTSCLFHSTLLLVTGYVIGGAIGFATGVALGWSKAAAYWGHPILRLIGPLPATAWLPIAFFIFPTSWSAAVFLVALAAGIPVAILTWSGVSSVASAYYDIARTLGGGPRFLVLKVAIPAAMPNVFVGLFMGLCSAFAVLVVAEMMGVKAGLGWYMSWAQGWAAYGSMYAALAVLAIMCSGLVMVLFRLRDYFLGWQKGLLRW